jgi:cell fate (sporulation/competence/biofilm development) regulator YlbF (YheA/YmcA/DUF963 family)
MNIEELTQKAISLTREANQIESLIALIKAKESLVARLAEVEGEIASKLETVELKETNGQG